MALSETTAVGAKASTATMGIFASAAIFTDPAYLVMMGIGAFVSLASVFHTIFSKQKTTFTKMQITAELIKGFVLGIVSMPLGFLILSEGILNKAFSIVPSSISLSASLVGAFIFSWFMTEILNALLKKLGVWSSKSGRYTEYNDDLDGYRYSKDKRYNDDNY